MKPAKILTFLLILFISFLLSDVRAAAGQAGAIRYVAPGGSDAGAPANDCKTSSHPCATIQHAVDQSNPGDEVRIAGGTYTGAVTIQNTLTLRGGYSTANWNVSNKTANPTKLMYACLYEDWEMGAAAIDINAWLAGHLVAIQDLDVDGCGIKADGELLVERVTLTNGSISQGAGANIPVTLAEVTITGGFFKHAAGDDSLATLSHVSITNSPEDGIQEKSGGALVMSDVQILNCAGAGISFMNRSGGAVTRGLVQGNALGIRNSSGGIVTLTQVQILDNTGRGVVDKSAGMVMNQVTIQGNHALSDLAADDPDYGDGGGYYTMSNQSTLTDVVIRGNTAAGKGGGIYDASGGLTLIRSTLAGNQAGQTGGGAWSMGELTLAESAVTGNQAAAGSGVFCDTCQLSLTNSAVSANTAGGVEVSGGGLQLLNTLVAGNAGAGVKVISGGQPAPVFDSSILGANSAGNCAITGALAGSHTISSDATCILSGGTNWTQTDPRLGGLLANGFYALSATSPAVDRGPAVCPATDYRGFPRPIDGDRDGVAICDIGPLEVGFDAFIPMVAR